MTIFVVHPPASSTASARVDSAYCRMRLSRVTSRAPASRAVAIRMRSAGSACGLPGRWALPTAMRGVSSTTRTPGTLAAVSIHCSGSTDRTIRPRSASIAISQMEMADMSTRPRWLAESMSLSIRADSSSSRCSAAHIHTWVSSNSGRSAALLVGIPLHIDGVPVASAYLPKAAPERTRR